MEVTRLMALNGINTELSDDEVFYIVECFHHRDKPADVALAIDSLRTWYLQEFNHSMNMPLWLLMGSI